MDVAAVVTFLMTAVSSVTAGVPVAAEVVAKVNST
jgi:hypothetical protein